MNEFNGVADTMLIPMAARIYVSKNFPEYFYDETALSLEEKIPSDALERIWKSSSEYTMNRYHKSADLKTRKIKEGKIWSSTIKNLRNRHCYCQMR